jgi:LmbE family N-acetylglucosaminyl deacetylase
MELALRKLAVAGSVLYIAAHPDDENSTLLAYLSRGQLLRTGYLALNRGEGGQNLIGAEKGIPLGILRTAELLAARKIDGAEQYFTRAYDFGYSKSVDETLRLWNREQVLADIVWNIRKFRPDIVVTRFPVTGEGRHGHHTASGVLAEEAFAAAADPKRFPEQLRFVDAWQARSLLLNDLPPKWNPAFSAEGKLALDIGLYNPVLGKSYNELAAASRTMHKSQGFGTASEPGTQIEYFTLRQGRPIPENPFASEHFSLKRFEGTSGLQSAIDKALQLFYSRAPAQELFRQLLRVRGLLAEIPDARWRVEKRAEVDRLLLDTSGVKLEALSGSAQAAAGTSLPLRLRVIRRQDTALQPTAVRSRDAAEQALPKLKTNVWSEAALTLDIPAGRPASNLYWLEQPLDGATYRVARQCDIGRPFSVPAETVEIDFHAGEETFSWQCAVEAKSLSQLNGDRYEEFSIVPPASVVFDLNAQFVPREQSRALTFSVTPLREHFSGTLTLQAPAGWRVEPDTFSIGPVAEHEQQRFSARLRPDNRAGDGVLRAEWLDNARRVPARSRRSVDYPHIAPHSYLQPAEVALSTAPLRSAKLRLGYINGAGDDVPEALRSIGLATDMLSDDFLLSGDLGRYDTIIVGIRALNTRTRWPDFYPRLMAFVAAGGTLLVQYSADDFLSKVPPHIGPYPFVLKSDRVTDEQAAVRVLLPSHPLLNSPNKILSGDFDNWVQERGLWFAGELDKHYSALLSMHDPGASELQGALIAAGYGKGHFIYTGLAFFRQLPAGNAGAFRLFVNLLNYGHGPR